jgi:predicted Zn finger-like uncharacterized protein
MSIIATCTHCQAKAKVRDELAGRTVKCPKCRESFRIPQAESASPVPAGKSSVTRVPPAARKPPARRRSDEEEDDDGPAGDDDSQDEDRPRKLPRHLPGTGLTGILAVALIVSIFVNLAFAWIAYETLLFFSRRLVPTADKATLETTINIAQWAVRIMLGFVFLVWVNRTVTNCRLLGARGMQFSPNWAVGLWLIPGLNIVLGWSLLQEVWQASDPKNLDGARRNWRRQPSSILAMVWCGVFWTCFILEFITRIMMVATLAEIKSARIPDFEGVVLIQKMFLAAAGLSVVAAVMFILFAMQLSDRQRKKLQALRKEAGLESDSDNEEDEDEDDDEDED